MTTNDSDSNTAQAEPAASAPKGDFDQLDHIATFRHFGRDEVLFEQGHRGGEAYIVMSGLVRISREDDGVTQEIDQCGPNNVIGEMAIISDMSRMATATALEDTVCIALSRSSMRRILATIDIEIRTTIEFLIDYIRGTVNGEAVDEDTMRRQDQILKYIVGDAGTKERLKSMEPMLVLLCSCLIHRAEERLKRSGS